MILRFTSSERWFHNIVMFTFLLLMITGLTLIYFNVIGEQASSRKFIIVIHKIIATFFIAGPVTAFFAGSRPVWRENIRILTTWGKDDIIWLAKKPLTILFPNMKMPMDDKFNPGQKIWATIAVCASLLLVLSGFFLWFADTSILAATMHTAVTLLMLVALAGHVFMALLNPDTNPGIGSILDGEVDETWAKHHHRLWYDRKRQSRLVRQGRPG